MAVFYLLTLLLLCTLLIMMRKSEDRQNFTIWLVFGSFLAACAQVLSGGILNLLGININLTTMAILNVLYCLLCGCWVLKKGWQQSYISFTDLIGVALLCYCVIEFAINRYGDSLASINFVSVDAATHARFAKEVAMTGKLSVGRFFAALLGGMTMNVYQALTGADDLTLYKGYIFTEVVFSLYSALVLWALLRDRMGRTGILKAIIPTIAAFLYWIGYPAYSTLFGFSYFGVSIVILTALLFLLERYFRQTEEKLFIIVMLNLVLTGIAVSYTLFVPAAFFGTFISIAWDMWKTDGKKVLSKKNIGRMFAIFLIPSVLGVFYNIQELQVSTSGAGGLNVDGGCYTDLYSNFVLLIPFTIIGLFFLIKKKEGKYILPILLIQFLFMGILFVMAMDGKVSAYYYMKNNSFLWMMCWVLVGETILYMMDNNKASILLLSYFIVFLAMGFGGDQWVASRNGRFIAVGSEKTFDIVHFNRLFYQSGSAIPSAEMELSEYVDKNLKNVEVAGIGGEVGIGWFKTLTNQERTFTYGSQADFLELIDEDVKYICALYSDSYNNCSEYLNSLETVYENSAGKILRIQ